jgi:hypothetical protein
MTHQHAGISEPDRLVQRFLDQELSAEERVRFVAELGRDEALRRRTIELERMLLDVGRLPRPAVPPDFARRVMARTAAAAPAPPAVWRRVIDLFRAPHEFRLSLAGAVASLVLLVGAGALGGALVRRTPPSTELVQTTATAPSTVHVRLVVVQPGARIVHVAGDFNGWDPARTPLEPAAGGAWTVTLPLKPGRYEYQFVVDGTEWIADPLAPEQNDDGFGSQNAVLEVRPAAGAPL